ncbi:hypothetical protein LEP1GSC193_3811 [Leptospira alstonii serovar Pingchang str. 80-412]|uniref:Uncharacterized protein n=2 Tax=Leptospira alstonii TaxID=28452 RepID=M6CVH1_9LEPT|nr:hypothetical protein LEP1GSC194_3089 [Leptospira alstonii serovar Sichuan str. 79601]EQA80747.1 hypothetical protein LEP1GSC193_3811 [Leptospira alstonii serovar Pingchang str. 80-412]
MIYFSFVRENCAAILACELETTLYFRILSEQILILFLI